MADTENAKKEGAPSCCPFLQGEGKIWVVGLLGLVVGLLVMYMAMPMFSSPQPPATEPVQAPAAAGTAFTLNAAKVTDIGNTLSDYFYVTTGSAVPVTYSRYELQSSHVVLYYTIDGNEMPVYISTDYVYLYPSALNLTSFSAQVETAKAEAEAANASTEATAAAATTELVPSAEPKVQIFVMSYCPYGNQAENALKDVVNLLADDAAFEPVYIISGSAGSYASLHGASELNEDIREKIIFNKYGEKKWMDFVYDTNANCTVKTIDTCWKEAANRTGVDIAAVEAEYSANFNAIADAEVAKVNAAGVSGSPTVIMNGVTYKGNRAAESFKSWICTGFIDEPAECNSSLNATSTAASGSC